MVEITKDDLYEIEKVLDIYAGMINDTMNKYCQTAIHIDAVNKIDGDNVNPMEKVVLELNKTRKRIKEIRDKLEQIRLLEEKNGNKDNK